MKQVTSIRVVALLSTLLWSVTATAHRQHFGWSAVIIKQAEQRIEITHRVHSHDAALLLESLNNQPVDITELSAQAQLALIVSEQFSIKVNQVVPQSVTLLGAELDGAYLLVFQEVVVGANIENLSLDSSILMNLYDDQLHVVNIAAPAGNTTLEFTAKSPALQVEVAALVEK